VKHSKHPRLLVVAGLLILFALALVSAGCAASAEATPTPTKTPRPEATQPPPATATPVPPTLVPPTATPVPPTAAPATDTPAPADAATAPTASDSSAQPAPDTTQAADQPISAKIVATLPPRQPGVSILTGLRPADPSVLERRPLAVKVDNDPAVIPQSGLGKADIVVETRKEGCLTRFTAIYQSQDSPKIGSVRSARLVDVELPVIFDAILAYSGAVGPVQQKLSQSDLGKQFLTQGSGGALFRDPKIAVPFNLFANTEAAWKVAAQKKWNTAPDPSAAWVFSEAAPAAGAPASRADFTYTKMYPHLKIGWTYDAGAGRWRRTIGGQPAIDKADGQQLTAANVVILGANHVQTLIPEQGTTLGKGPCSNASIEIQLWGEGPAKILRDGKVYEGKWVRPDRHAPFRFIDAKGQDIPLKPGNSWWQIVPMDVKVTVAP
jgi:hypothetical protein